MRSSKATGFVRWLTLQRAHEVYPICCDQPILLAGKNNRRDNKELAVAETIRPSPASQSELIKAIMEVFVPRFVPGADLVYTRDKGEKSSHADKTLLSQLGVEMDGQGKMPDVVLYDPKRKWLLLVESITSNGPVDGQRRKELARLFSNPNAALIYVTAFPSRAKMASYLGKIAWETEAWCADAPSHLIHFNGSRLLGPYK